MGYSSVRAGAVALGLTVAGCTASTAPPALWHTSFDDLGLWTVDQAGSGTGAIEIVDWPAEHYDDPLTGKRVPLGGRVARVRFTGAGQITARREDLPPQGVVTVYFREVNPSGPGRARLFVADRDANGAELAYSAGTNTSAPPGGHWQDFGSEDGRQPNDYHSFLVVQPQHVTGGSFEFGGPDEDGGPDEGGDPYKAGGPYGPGGSWVTSGGLSVADSDVVMPTAVRRGAVWHELKIRVTPHGTFVRIDGANVVRAMPAVDGVLPFNPQLRHMTGAGFGTFAGEAGAVREAVEANEAGEAGALGEAGKAGEAGQTGEAGDAGDVEILFDEMSVTDLPPLRSVDQLAADQIDAYLAAYGHLSDPDQIAMVERVRARPPDDPGSLSNAIHNGMALMWTYGWTASAHGVRYRLTGNADDRDRALRIMRMIVRDYSNWRSDATREATISSVVLQSVLTAAWFMWDDLSPAEREQLRHMALVEVEEAEGQLGAAVGVDHPFGSEFIGDSTAEQNSMPASNYLHLLWLFPGDARADHWRERLAFYSYHTITDSHSPPLGGERTQTVWDEDSVAAANALVPEHALIQAMAPGHRDDHLFDNHNFHPHPSYAYFAAMPGFWQRWLGRIETEPPRLTSALQRDVLLRALEFVDLETFRYRGENIFRLRRVGQDQVFVLKRPNVFQATGLDDWGVDGLDLAALVILSDTFGVTAYVDPVSGTGYPDLLAQALSVAHYMDHTSLRVWVPPGAHFAGVEDMDRRDYRSLAYAWEMRNRPGFAMAYYTFLSERIPPPDVAP